MIIQQWSSSRQETSEVSSTSFSWYKLYRSFQLFKPLVPNAVGDQIQQFDDDLTVEDNNNLEEPAENSRADTANKSYRVTSNGLVIDEDLLVKNEIDWRNESYREKVSLFKISNAPIEPRFNLTDYVSQFLSENLDQTSNNTAT